MTPYPSPTLYPERERTAESAPSYAFHGQRVREVAHVTGGGLPSAREEGSTSVTEEATPRTCPLRRSYRLTMRSSRLESGRGGAPRLRPFICNGLS
jgi:hypothetical protein